jgi:phospholipid/cholesterol/gamma-HCH transport system permease protein
MSLGRSIVTSSLSEADSYTHRYVLEHVQTEAGATLHIRGRLELGEAGPLWAGLDQYALSADRGTTLNFDMAGVERIDGSAMALLAHLRARLQQRGVSAEFVGASPVVQEIIHLYRGDVRVGRKKRRRAPGTLDQIGQATLATVAEMRFGLAFLGYLVVEWLGVLRAPKTGNWRDLFPTMERTGPDALPIVLLINFLVGMVVAFQSSPQLEQYGANIFLADLIGISMTRELGPLLTAVVVCGRSGAAFAAELGSMQVNEEIDALRTMGFGPMRYLVLPRVLALMLVMPILTLLADIVGTLGGLAVGIYTLELTPISYFTELQKAVTLSDFLSGITKSVVFGLTIGLIACQQGLATSGGAEGVGRRTTSAVVTTLFTLVVIDAIFTIFFQAARL